MSDLYQRTQAAMTEFDQANTSENFYMMTDGGEALDYAEGFELLLSQWLAWERELVSSGAIPRSGQDH